MFYGSLFAQHVDRV